MAHLLTQVPQTFGGSHKRRRTVEAAVQQRKAVPTLPLACQVPTKQCGLQGDTAHCSCRLPPVSSFPAPWQEGERERGGREGGEKGEIDGEREREKGERGRGIPHVGKPFPGIQLCIFRATKAFHFLVLRQRSQTSFKSPAPSPLLVFLGNKETSARTPVAGNIMSFFIYTAQT